MDNQLSPNSIDDDSRMRDFLSRHGGAGSVRPRRGESMGGLRGWTELYAVDGYVLRCDWVKQGGRTEMRYQERAHRENAAAGSDGGQQPAPMS